MIINTGKLSISVIVNTVDRAGPLHTLLCSLENQSYPNFEVIVVVGPTRDNTLDILSEYQGRVRILHCPVANLSYSRNIGLLAARGDLVAYIDDDSVPGRRWLEQFARIFNEQEIEMSGGDVWSTHPMHPVQQFRLGVYSSLGEQIDVRSSWIDQIIPSGMSTYWVPRFMGTNMVGRREALLEAGGFDEFFGFVAEECDLALRLANAGKNVFPVREAIVYHFPASSRNRVIFTTKGKWWLRSRSRAYLGIKNGLLSGEPLRKIAIRNMRSAMANFPIYFSFLRNREISLAEFAWMGLNEIWAGSSGLARGLFAPRRLIPTAKIEAAKKNSEMIVKFQNTDSVRQPSVDPVTGRQPMISILEPPLRICLLSYSYPPPTTGGVARLTNLMAQGLFELGHTVHVITQAERESVTFYDGAYVHKIPNRLERYENYRHFLNLFGTLNYSHNVYDKVKQLMLNDGIQLVDSALWQFEGLVTLKSKTLPVVVRLVTGVRQVTEIHKFRPSEFGLLGDLEKHMLEKASYLLPNTNATLNAIRKVYELDLDNRRHTIVPYGIVPVTEDQVRPFELGRENRPFTVLFVGRLEKRKGILDLFEAMPIILKQFANVKFVFAGGDNSEYDGFKNRTGMDYPTYFAKHYSTYVSYVQFMGLVSEEVLQNLYQSCDLFVAPSLYESFGLIYLEAMNYAKPVIGCKAGGIPEVVDDGVTGILVEPEAPKTLAEAIISLLKSPMKLREMGLAGRSQILSRYHYLEMARKFEKVYRQVIYSYNNNQTSDNGHSS